MDLIMKAAGGRHGFYRQLRCLQQPRCQSQSAGNQILYRGNTIFLLENPAELGVADMQAAAELLHSKIRGSKALIDQLFNLRGAPQRLPAPA